MGLRNRVERLEKIVQEREGEIGENMTDAELRKQVEQIVEEYGDVETDLKTQTLLALVKEILKNEDEEG